MDRSESIKELATALCKAQAKIEGASKDKTNPHFRSKYADLSSVREAINKPATDEGLSYVQVLHDGDAAAAKVETVIMHRSGEWLSCGVIAVPVSKADAQGYGSALTYARRYSLSAAFGVAPEDDDGVAASAAAPRHDMKITPTAGAKDNVSPEERQHVLDVVNKVRDWITAESYPDAAAVIDEEAMGAEEAVFFWTFFDSKERAKLKLEGQARRKRVMERELASQA